MVAKSVNPTVYESALHEAQALREEYSEMDQRSSEIGQQIEQLTRQMGEARLAKKNTLGIHKQIMELEQEHKEIISAMQAMAPLRVEADWVISEARREKYVAEYAAANEESRKIAEGIIPALDAVHCELVELNKIQRSMQVASAYTGKQNLPGPATTLPVDRVWSLIQEALSLIEQANGPTRAKQIFARLHVADEGRRRSEYTGQLEIER